ncbi:acetyl/propionyl/methylcrotonyl-CoA carboxylase subunit alpha [Enteractinococcus coprophilus]|uniref:biotin carboxylase n=1 Tax=Enteractinococcus coprophilus TaxID=1027633 RepID=A0A543AK52_9MICC|nr:biotin carboxylase N-terminal domain-containing protein [Enteractinococcus coprophilus]TQL72906.1 acetyl-CoA/propionyl-CoA carboxylase biotin carboxyl carrier protein [Enteractinococcus coprophilus]
MQLFSKVLIANRGEIAMRIAKTLHQLGIRSVAIYSDADLAAAHVRFAQEAIRLGTSSAESYLNPEAVVQAALATGAEAIHPGYGFLSENVELARECRRAGVTFIGPNEYALEIMGDKIRSKNHVAKAGVPMIEGVSRAGLSNDQLVEATRDMSFPMLIKPSAGGGGKGMHVVESHDQLAGQLETARRVAQTAFGDDTLLIEQLIRSPRHIEVQILADQHGNVIHLGERECSLQRRHQKIIEEAPSVLLSEDTRARIGQAAVETARSVDYVGAGTVEFLVSDQEPDKFYFMEMNTRLQVEHPITEEITGIDLVEEQIRIAAGAPLTLTQDAVTFTGHAIEARVYAESPAAGFLPSTGTVLHLSEPTGVGVRVDSGLRTGSVIGTEFDPMIAKVIATGTDRHQALARLDQALDEMIILGVHTNLEYLQHLLRDADVVSGDIDTTLVESRLPDMAFDLPTDWHAQVAARFLHQQRATASDAWALDGFRLPGAAEVNYRVDYPAADAPLRFDVALDTGARLIPTDRDDEYVYQNAASVELVTVVAEAPTRQGARVWVASNTFTGVMVVLDHAAQVLDTLASMEAEERGVDPQVRAPLPGTVTAIHLPDGSEVSAGDPVVTIEAMKMEHQLQAPLDGTVTIHVTDGQQVSLDQSILTVVGHASTDDQ